MTAAALSSDDGTDLYPLYLLLKMLAKYTTFSALVSIRLLIIEIFPTPVRGSLVGLTAMFGLLGSGLGYYYSVMVGPTSDNLPGFGLALFYPATANRRTQFCLRQLVLKLP